MNKKIFCFCAVWLFAVTSVLFAETILQEFSSKKDFDAFWDVSTWGNANQQYSADNVNLDTVKGWLQLKINASPQGTKPVCGEITSKRANFLYGSYRASIKFDNIPGGVVGWFVFKDEPDLHEVDIEYLTEDIKHIHYTLHHIQTSVDYKKDAISFDPTTDFHEYRFDWYSNKVVYYIDGKKFDSLTVKVPDAACIIMLNFWSGNIAAWGGPAPTKDTYMYVDYMHYYSDLASKTTMPGNGQNKKHVDLRIVLQDLQNNRYFLPKTYSNIRLYKCNGQSAGLKDNMNTSKPPASGQYILKIPNKGEAIVLPCAVIR